MTLPLSPDELLSTTRAVRRRLDLTRPVERAVIEECLDLALQAPSASNRQTWEWVFVDDPAKKSALAALYREVFDTSYPAPTSEADPRQHRLWSSAHYLAEHFHEVPLILVPCQKGRPEGANQAGFWASILPAVWSFHLALRSRGLGSAWTTMHLTFEREAAAVLGIAYEDYSQAGMFPIAYTTGGGFRRGPRKPLESVIHWNRW